MTKNNDDCREAFEKWHSNKFEQHLPSLRTEYGYDLQIVHQRWVGWQGAYNTRAPVENSSENRQMDSNVSKQSTHKADGEL